MIMASARKPPESFQESQPRALVLHLPERKRPGGLDLSLTAGVLLLAGVAAYLAAHLPAPKAPVEETLELLEEAPPAPPPEEIKDRKSVV